jgi:hypothetical protein
VEDQKGKRKKGKKEKNPTKRRERKERRWGGGPRVDFSFICVGFDKIVIRQRERERKRERAG